MPPDQPACVCDVLAAALRLIPLPYTYYAFFLAQRMRQAGVRLWTRALQRRLPQHLLLYRTTSCLPTFILPHLNLQVAVEPVGSLFYSHA